MAKKKNSNAGEERFVTSAKSITVTKKGGSKPSPGKGTKKGGR